MAIVLLLSSVSLAENFKVKSLPDKPALTGEVEYVPGEILVKYKEGVSSQRMADLSSSLGTSILSVHRGGVRKLSVPAGKTEREMIALLERDPRVEYAELNTKCHAFMTPNDPYYSPYQWHFPQVNCPAAWDISTGTGVVVAVLDAGIAYEDYPVPAYESNTVQSGVTSYEQAPDFAGTAFVPGYDFINDDSHPNDNNGHGTHVAGTIAQTTNNSYGVAGMAFDCSLMPVKVLDYTGSGSASSLADGLYWATDNGAQVINMSLGWSPGYNPGPTVENAIIYAYDHGVVLVASSGNAGVSPVSYPAAYSQVIAVGATRYDDQLVDYSQYGSEQELVAPGGDLDVDQNGDGYGDAVLQQSFDPYDPGPPEVLANPTVFGWWFYVGTSQASPHVSALVAMMIANGQTGIENIRTILHETSVDLGATGWDQYYGYGRIDAYAALTYGGTPPVADFSGTPTSGCVSLTVDFTDMSSGDPTSWSWDFGDGVGTSTAQNPSYTYNAAGNYTVTLTATNEYGSDTETKTNYISVSDVPVAGFSGSPTSGQAPLTVDFTDESTGNPTSWSWDFGDGGTSVDQNPTYTYNDSGDYTVTLTASNACGSDVETKVDYIHVDPPGGAKAFALSDIPVKGTVSGDYTNTHTSDNLYEVITERESGGKPANRYSYLEHKWDFNVASGTSIAFYVEAYRPDNSEGDDFSFEYSTDNSSFTPLLTVNSATEQTYSAAMPSSISGTVYIRVVDADQTPGNRNLDAVYVDYMYIESTSGPVPPVANFDGSPTSGSVPLTVSFTDLSSGDPTSWTWDFGDGGSSNIQNPTHEYTVAGTYSVSLTVSNAYGSDTETKVDYITVTEGGCVMHVHDIVVTRKTAGPNCNGIGTIYIYDANNQPVSDATVYATATGPVGGDFTGVTDVNGIIVFQTGKTRDCAGEWCFEVTNVTHSSCTYDPAANIVTKACESGPVYKGSDLLAEVLPSEFGLAQNYPNPFNPTTVISFNLRQASDVTLEVFNIAGQKVTTLVAGRLEAGPHSYEWDAADYASGVYLYRLQTSDYIETKKMMLLK